MIQRKLLAVNKAMWGFVSRLPTSPGVSVLSWIVKDTDTQQRWMCFCLSTCWWRPRSSSGVSAVSADWGCTKLHQLRVWLVDFYLMLIVGFNTSAVELNQAQVHHLFSWGGSACSLGGDCSPLHFSSASAHRATRNLHWPVWEIRWDLMFAVWMRYCQDWLLRWLN